MNRVLNKRILRDLKANFMRCLALFLLIVMGMYIIVSVVGAAETIITESVRQAEENMVEDGRFSVFIPLSSEQENELSDSGITIEKVFHIDVESADNSVIRLMKNRKNIDLIKLDFGSLAGNENQIVLEKRYCEEHNISVGNTIEIAGKSFIVTGIGTVPDYDMPTREFSDTAVESTLFGLGFVTDEQYEQIKSSGCVKTEEYCYSYRLNGAISHSGLKEKLKAFKFDYNDIEDKYFREMIEETLGKKENIQEGINELSDGAEELSDGIGEIGSHSGELTDGAEKIFDSFLLQANSSLAAMGMTEKLTRYNYGEILDNYISLTNSAELISLKNTLDSLKDFSDGITDYTNGVSEAYDGSEELSEGVAELKTETDELLDDFFEIDIDNLTSFTEAGDNPRILAAAGDMQMNKNVGLIAGVIVMILFTYVISVFVIHQIQCESSVIGALYALGAKKRNLISHYICLPTVITFLGGIIGAALGFSKFGIPYQMADTYSYYSVPKLETIYPIYLIIYAVVMPPIISVIVNSIVINKRLSQTALSLIKNEQKLSNRSRIDLGKMKFIRRFQVRQMLREARTGITVVFGMVISLLIFMMGLDCEVLCVNIGKDNAKDTKFEYMYTLKYPEKTVPENAEACYIESLSKTEMGYTLDISIVGIDDDNKYYGVTPVNGKSSIIIGSSVAQKYGLKVGDKLILTDSANDMDYAFTIKEIADYSVGLSVFMDIDSMRELFEQENDYYNMLLSDEALDIDEGRIYAVTTRSDIERSSSVFTGLMKPMVTMMISVSLIIFCVVMYLMMNVMIERASFGISLIKIFGFRTGEVKKLYLNGNTLIVALGAIVGIPIAKMLMDKMYPSFIANISCGMNLAFPWYYYALIFVGIMLVYFAVNSMLVFKLKKITPVEVLKNRE